MTESEWTEIKHFVPAEFDSPDAPGSGVGMQVMFMYTLDAIREGCGFPFHIMSGIRTVAHNTTVGGVDGSAHTGGWAADIALTGRTSGEITYRRALIVGYANLKGIRRIGIGKTFVHLDMDPTLPTPRMWLYEDK